MELRLDLDLRKLIKKIDQTETLKWLVHAML